MHSKLIVGVEDSEHSRDAVKLGATLAREAGGSVLLAAVVPSEHVHGRIVSDEFERALRADAEAALDAAAAQTGDLEPEWRVVPDRSVARGLQGLADEVAASLIVIGSTHYGPVGRVLSGSVAQRLLHGSPCPVAVAPAGYADADTEIRVVGVAFDGGEESRAALEAARDLGAALGASLRVIAAVEPPGFGDAVLAGYADPSDTVRGRLRAALDEAVEGLPGALRAEPVLVDGAPAQVLVEQSETADLMIAGSRGYGPLGAVLLGSVSARLMRAAQCPVIVVPRGARAASAPAQTSQGAGAAD